MTTEHKYYTFHLRAVDGRMMMARLRFSGDSYGSDDRFIHDDDEPVIEFWDTNIEDYTSGLDSWGRYVDGEYLHYFMKAGTPHTLVIGAHIPPLSIPASQIKLLRPWIIESIEQHKLETAGG